MSRGNPELLRAAAARKSVAAHERAENGIRALLKKGEAITFEGVAEAGGVSKDYLYRTADLRARLEDLRARTACRPATPRSEPESASSTGSIVRTLTTKLTEERTQHRREITELKQAPATAHGEILTLRRRHGDQS